MGRLNARAIAVALTVVLVGATAAMVVGNGGSGTAAVPATPDSAGDAVVATDGQSPTDSPTARLDCTNGTSPAVVACGYTPGPNAVAFHDQETTGANVTVAAVELEADGFVAVHRVSYVDGAFTESVVGVSEELPAGLHRDIEVTLDEQPSPASGTTLLAVVYADGDDDGSFDFVSSDGADDRPFTNTYSERGGNVTDEAGDVIGDQATVSVTGPPVVIPGGPPARSVDDDPQLEDIDGDGEVTVFDAMAYYNNRNSAAVQTNPTLFDFDGDGDVGTIFDAVALYENAD